MRPALPEVAATSDAACPHGSRVRWLLALAVVAACSHELRRDRMITSGRLGERTARVELFDRVEIEHPCSVWRWPAYIFTFGLAYIYESAMEAKFGRRCPSTETVYEHPGQLMLSIASSDPRKTIGSGPPPCLFATRDEACVVDRRASVAVPAGVPPTASVRAVSPDRTKVVVARPCRILSLGDGHEVPIPRCESVRFANRDTLVVGLGLENGQGTVVDVESGVVLGEGDPNWLGSSLALVRTGALVEVVRREGWTVLATIDLKHAISDATALWLVGGTSILVVRPGVDPVRIPLAVTIDGVLDARGDIALVELHGATPAVAAIRLSTGAVIARSP